VRTINGRAELQAWAISAPQRLVVNFRHGMALADMSEGVQSQRGAAIIKHDVLQGSADPCREAVEGR